MGSQPSVIRSIPDESVVKGNVVVFGSAGTGKSSMINLLAGQNCAIVSDGAVGCTFETQMYVLPEYNLYDTSGLNEGAQGKVSTLEAIKNLFILLQSLKSGVSLLVFVIKKGRIDDSVQKNYKLFVESTYLKKVPVLLMVTNCEDLPDPFKWWIDNRKHFDGYGMTFNGVVCGCTMNYTLARTNIQPDIKEMNDKTASELIETIKKTWNIPGWTFKDGPRSWFYAIHKNVFKIINPGRVPADLQDRLYKYFLEQQLDSSVAKQWARELATNKPTEHVTNESR